MKTVFLQGAYTAKYNQTNKVFDVYKDNLKVAVIYEESESVRFTHNDVIHDITDLIEVKTLTRQIYKQYELLNP